MRIGIITFHKANNCGALLQAWALKTVVERLGHTVTFPNLNVVGYEKTWHAAMPKGVGGYMYILRVAGKILRDVMAIGVGDVRYRRFNEFRRQHLREVDCHVREMGEHYDCIIVGSDQVWNEAITQNDAPLFFAEEIDPGMHKIAYAASCGDEAPAGKALDRVVAAIQRFNKVSFRERACSEKMARILNRDRREMPVVLDPSLLLTSLDYDKIACGKIPREPYLFMYLLSTNKYSIDIARKLAQRLGVRCIIAPVSYVTRFKEPRGLTGGISPDRLVCLTKHAKYIVSASFHGTVMGLLFNKPFLSVRAVIDKHETRIESLLNLLGMRERIVNPSVSEEKMVKLLNEPLPKELPARLETLRQGSLKWLTSALDEI